MSYAARVFRVLIASPSDVEEEREIAVRTIQEWNDLNSAERQLVLLPLRWETHSAPEFGRHPQEILNRQIVDHADLLVGVFWTKIGSPTGTADSGTLEEIERVASNGKPVMLYFSQIKQHPDNIDIEQLGKLREFKKKTFPKALVEKYSTQIEFRDKLSKHLEIQLRTLISEDAQSGHGAPNYSPVTDIQFEFAEPETGAKLGTQIGLKSTAILISRMDEVADYIRSVDSKLETEGGTYLFIGSRDNRDYYRDAIKYFVGQSLFRPVRFWLRNSGGVGARDVYVDIRVNSKSAGLRVVSSNSAELQRPSKDRSAFVANVWSNREDDQVQIEQVGPTWSVVFELRALQPQREISTMPVIFMAMEETGTVDVEARIFADTLAEPTRRKLEIDWVVERSKRDANQLLIESGIEPPTIAELEGDAVE